MLKKEHLALLFTAARSYNHWQDRPVSDLLLGQLYELMKWGPTSANCSPARIVFVRAERQKEKLIACMSPGNHQKTRAAPVTAIIGMDMAFIDTLPVLFPHDDARPWFAGNQELIVETAFRNSTLQGAYLMQAARALGLDCGPMSGFDAEKVNAAFFAGTEIRVNFMCNLGYGCAEGQCARLPRLPFDLACTIL